MQIGKALNLWGLGVNFLLVVLFGAFRTQSYFPFLAMIVIAALVVMPILATIRRVRFAKPELRVLVSLYGTSMLWIPLFVDSFANLPGNGFLGLLVDASLYVGFALLLLSAVWPRQPGSKGSNAL